MAGRGRARYSPSNMQMVLASIGEEEVTLSRGLGKMQITSTPPPAKSAAAPSSSSMSSRTKLEYERMKEQLRYLEQERAASSKARVLQIKEVLQRAQEVDIAFLLDATNSMKKSFQMVKNEINGMAAGISLSYPQCKLRFALTVYRDYDSPKVGGLDGCNFTSNYKGPNSTFSNTLSQIQLSWGVDDAEDVFTGLENAAKLDWQAMNRLLVHIGDAPCHGSQFHDDTVPDDYPKGDKYGRSIQAILRKLRETCRITRYFFCHINKQTLKMIQEFRKAAGRGDWVEEWQINDLSKVPDKVIAASRAAITESISLVQHGGAGQHIFAKEKVDHRIPDWNRVRFQEGTEFVHRQCSSLDQLLKTIQEARPLDLMKTAVSDVHVQIALSPFSEEGNLRYPYYALVAGRDSDKPGRVEVVKRFKTELGKSPTSQHTKQRYVQQMEVQTVARQLAQEFNKSTSRLPGVPKVKFTEVCLLETEGKFYTKEKLLKGEWTRFSNNGEYVNKVNYAATLQAFSHWTYYITSGLLMVTDLQGVKVRDPSVPGQHVFRLCDPAIHTNDANVMRFSNTNFGEDGCKLFLQSHQCNDVCRHLRLPTGRAGNTDDGTLVQGIKKS
ncbi:hypothetical protein R1flu_014864 [Riccia fluitans]|uniref:Alpha-type protein kinase domain-containing protein n=1 Tax=Riccia fluitans TaxID=41844 RepID=A0ABD1YHL0_9MARC